MVCVFFACVMTPSNSKVAHCAYGEESRKKNTKERWVNSISSVYCLILSLV